MTLQDIARTVETTGTATLEPYDGRATRTAADALEDALRALGVEVIVEPDLGALVIHHAA